MARVFGALVDTTRKRSYSLQLHLRSLIVTALCIIHVLNQCATSIVCVCSSVHSGYSVSPSAPCESVLSTSSAHGYSQLVHCSTVQHHSIHGVRGRAAVFYMFTTVSYIQRLPPVLGA